MPRYYVENSAHDLVAVYDSNQQKILQLTQYSAGEFDADPNEEIAIVAVRNGEQIPLAVGPAGEVCRIV